MADTVRVNGVQMGWPSVSLKLDGTPTSGVTSIEYADGVEQGLTYGTGRHYAPRGRTLGKYTPEPFVMTVYAATAREIRSQLAAKASGRGISRVAIPIVLQYVEPDDGATVTVEALDSTLVKNEASNEEGADALTEKLTFQPLRLKRNGITLYDTTAQGA